MLNVTWRATLGQLSVGIGRKAGYISLSGLGLDIILYSPFWHLCDNFKSPIIKSISQIHNTKTFQTDVSHISLKI